jgi:Family of unknown function (DUF5681)
MTRKGRNYRNKKPRAVDYSVGYGRPPLASRFKPGMSGNTRGRPKGSRNVKTQIEEAMTAGILIQVGAKTKRVSTIAGVVLRQLHKALMGDGPAAIAVIKMALQLGLLQDSSDSSEISLSIEDERILNELLARSRKSE